MSSTNHRPKARVQHPVILMLRQELYARWGEYEQIARKAGVTPRSLRALNQGTMLEMTATRELELAEALGYVVSVQKKGGARSKPNAP